VKFERERELVEGALGRKGIIMTIIIIIIIWLLQEVRTNRPRGILNHTDQTDESFR
jgi:hypothetical protein